MPGPVRYADLRRLALTTLRSHGAGELARRRRTAYALIATACALPRLAVVVYERQDLLGDPGVVDKGFVFAQTFVSTGTYGYSGGNPSADTQPLYGFFLIPLEWLFGMSWPAVGIAQTVIAIATAWIVYEIGRGWLTAGIGLAAAMASTLHPYMVWHDVHVAREVLDSLLAAALVLATLVAARRRSVPTAALAGAATGLAALGNVRLTSLAIVLAMYLLYAVRPVRRSAPLALALLLAAALVLSPWVMRNRVQVGCYSITTHAEGFWKANSEETYRTLAAGDWIDDVPSIAAPADECERMRFFPGAGLRLLADGAGREGPTCAALGAEALGSPSRSVRTHGRVLGPSSALRGRAGLARRLVHDARLCPGTGRSVLAGSLPHAPGLSCSRGDRPRIRHCDGDGLRRHDPLSRCLGLRPHAVRRRWHDVPHTVPPIERPGSEHGA